MNEALPKPAVVVLDVKETLTDMSPLRDLLVDVGASGTSFDTWFAVTLRDGFVVAAAGGYADLGDIARRTVTGLLASRPDLAVDPARAADDVLAGVTELDVHPDVPEGLRRLHEGGVRLAPYAPGYSGHG